MRGHVVYHYISVILAFQFASHSQRLKVICGCLGCHFIRLSNNSVFFFIACDCFTEKQKKQLNTSGKTLFLVILWLDS